MSVLSLLPIRALKRMLLTAPTVGCLLVAPISAQTIRSGARVRITAGDEAARTWEGNLVRSSADTIWFKQKHLNVIVALPLQKGYRVEQNTLYRRRQAHTMIGASIGLPVGGGVGILVMIVGCGFSYNNVNFCDETTAYTTIVAGAVVGGVVGGVIGFKRIGEQWENVSMPVRVSTLHLPARQIQLGSIKF